MQSLLLSLCTVVECCDGVVAFFVFVVVTGCTHGIGEAYADELAQYGLNVVLLSRNNQSLHNVARDLGR